MRNVRAHKRWGGRVVRRLTGGVRADGRRTAARYRKKTVTAAVAADERSERE